MRKKRSFLFLFLLSALCLAGVWISGLPDRIAFSRLTDAFFTQSLSQDPLSLHFTLADPEDYGIRQSASCLPVFSALSASQSEKTLLRLQKKLRYIRPKKLREEERYTYDLLCTWLEQRIRGLSFPYYEEPLSPSSGMHCELPLLFAEYTLRNEADVRRYLSLLESVGPYLQGLADFEAQKAKAGLFMTDSDVRAVIAQCDRILDADALSAGTHFLQTTFRERLDTLREKKQLTTEQTEAYLLENDRILTTTVLGAYQKLTKDLTALMGSGRFEGGLASMPEGRQYYAWLVSCSTGTSLNMEELYELLQRTFRKKYGDYRQLLLEYRAQTDALPDPDRLNAQFPLFDPDEILSDLKSRMRQDFPPLPGLSKEGVQCEVKDVDAALEPFTSPAFYMSPPIDDLIHNTICINRSSTAGGIELYTTLAHEGYPGHLYQTVYSSQYIAVENDQPVRELLFFGGYVEGWAYYTEQISFAYAAQLLQERGADPSAALLCRMLSVQRDLQINLFSLLDISLHYYGASREEILRSLTSFGLPEDTARQIYDYLRTDPAVYLKYYVGYLEMSALRQRAAVLWGEEFSLQRFHRFVLQAGPSDFKNLTRRLKSAA